MLATATRNRVPCAVVLWLAVCCVLVFAMVVLGGAVRLSGAGLSMVDWRPLSGAWPPLGDAQWQLLFDRYRQFPEYQQLNRGLTLGGFQFLFWMEYAHRMLGRFLGLVFLLPLALFLWRGMLPRRLTAHLGGLFLLGAAQALLGWYMVQSGLWQGPHVSHYRLLAHFMLAVFIYGWMVTLTVSAHDAPRTAATGGGATALVTVLLMMASGALVAGTRAGHIYDTWPRMGGQWIPPHLLAMAPPWRNFLDNPIAIQFLHRWFAVAVLIAVGGFALRLLRARATGAAAVLAGLVAVQIALGITTLVLRVPAPLGVAHQAGAMALLTALLVIWARRLPPGSWARGAAAPTSPTPSHPQRQLS